MNAFELALSAVVALVALGIGTFGGFVYARETTQRKHAEQLNQQKESAEARLLEIQAQQRDALREAKDETTKIRTSLESENRERRQEIKRHELRLQQKEEQLDRKIEGIEKRERQLSQRQQELDTYKIQLEQLQIQRTAELERVGRMNQQEAREELIRTVEETARRDS
ncbi:MAG: ribonuclease Y, partial [Chloroflexi bacterium]